MFEIDINVWESSEAPTKGTLKGPLLSFLAPSGNVGHIDMVITVSGEKENLTQLQENFQDLQPKVITIYGREKIISDPDLLQLDKLLYELRYKQWDYVSNEYKRKEIKALRFDHSFWPKVRPSTRQVISGFFGRGVVGEFRTVNDDLISEAKEVELNGRKITPYTEHRTLGSVAQKKIYEIKEQLDSLYKQKENLNSEKIKFEKNLDQLNESLKEYKAQKNRFSNQLRDIRKNLRILNTGGDELNQVLAELAYIQKSLVCTMIEKNNKAIERIQDEILITAQTLVDINEQLDSIKNDELSLNEERKEVITRQEQEMKTKGKNPDYSIRLNSGKGPHAYSIEKILKAMSDQRKNPDYSLGKDNCASAIKKCILAGILDLKDNLIAAGLSEDFFKLGYEKRPYIEIESPMGVLHWVIKLNSYMTYLNVVSEKEETKQLKI